MWQEARKQEKKLRGMIVDYQRRAQRRKDFYEKIKSDPTQFIQLHARPCKINLDPTIATAAESPATMMPWQGNRDIMIDRFDGRAHLDIIPQTTRNDTNELSVSQEERAMNYERYRILVQNEFFGIPEDKFLHQIYLEEKFGSTSKNAEAESAKKSSNASAAIGYNYEEQQSTAPAVSSAPKTDASQLIDPAELETGNDSDSDLDLDLTFDVSKIELQQANDLNICAHNYGMATNDFFSFLNNDLEEAEAIKILKENEEKKALFSGRRLKKDRKVTSDGKPAPVTIHSRKSPPRYAVRSSPSYESYQRPDDSKSNKSRSNTPAKVGKITFITSFGDEENTAPDVARKRKSNGNDKNIRKRRIRLSKTRKGIRGYYRSLSRSRSSSGSRRRTSRSPRSRRRRSKSPRRSPRRNRSWTRRSPRRSRSLARRSTRRSRSLKRRLIRRSRSSSLQRSSMTSPQINSQFDEKINFNETDYSKITSKGDHKTDVSSKMPLPRYYERAKNQDSSSDLSLSDDEKTIVKQFKHSSPTNINSGQVAASTKISITKVNAGESKMSIQEKLKRKRQVLLNKQYKADKKAERDKIMKAEQERLEREEELSQLTMKLRHRQRLTQLDNEEESANPRSSRSSSSSKRSGRPSRSRSPRSMGRSLSRGRSRSRSRRRSFSRGRSRSISRRRSRSRRRSQFNRSPVMRRSSATRRRYSKSPVTYPVRARQSCSRRRHRSDSGNRKSPSPARGQPIPVKISDSRGQLGSYDDETSYPNAERSYPNADRSHSNTHRSYPNAERSYSHADRGYSNYDYSNSYNMRTDGDCNPSGYVVDENEQRYYQEQYEQRGYESRRPFNTRYSNSYNYRMRPPNRGGHYPDNRRHYCINNQG